MTNVIGESLRGAFRSASAGLGALGQGLERRRQREEAQEREQVISGLLQRADQGDTLALAELARFSPQSAEIISRAGQAEAKTEAESQKARLLDLGNFAQTLMSSEDPNKIRAGLLQRARGEQDQEVKAELLDAANMDDDAMMLDIRQFVSGARTALGELQDIDRPEQFETLSQVESSQLGFGRGAVVQKDSSGKLSVVQEGAKPPKNGLASPIAVPESIIANLPEESKQQARDVFVATGGGKEGIKAVNQIIEQSAEQVRRERAPEALSTLYPNANDQEVAQLQSAIDSAETVEKGLEEAGKLRAEQRRLVKAKSFQDRAVNLLDSILDNDQLDDVVGSIEGAYDLRLFSDAEAELISDIEEAGNILTAENLDLMSGVLSESDIKLLKSLASGALNRKRTETRFVNDVTELRNKLSSKKVQVTGENVSSMSDQDLLDF